MACSLVGWLCLLAGWLAGFLAGFAYFTCLLARSLARSSLACRRLLTVMRVLSTAGAPAGGWRQSKVDLQDGRREVHRLARPAGSGVYYTRTV